MKSNQRWYAIVGGVLLLNAVLVIVTLGVRVAADEQQTSTAKGKQSRSGANSAENRSHDKEESSVEAGELQDGQNKQEQVQSEVNTPTRIPTEQGRGAKEQAGGPLPGDAIDDPLYRDVEQFYLEQTKDLEQDLNVLLPKGDGEGAFSAAQQAGSRLGVAMDAQPEFSLRLRFAARLIHAAEDALRLAEQLRRNGQSTAAMEAFEQAQQLRSMARNALGDKP